MARKSIASSAHKHDALAAFLKSHVGTAFSDDVGPLFGQAALVRESGVPDAGMRRYWNDAVSAALTAEASSDAVLSGRAPAKIRAPRKRRAR